MSTRRANGDGRPYWDEAKGRWYVAIELDPGPDGRRRRKVSGHTAAEARKAARTAREQAANGIPLPDRGRTVGSFLDWWVAEAIPGTVSESTVVAYSGAVRRWIKPHIGRQRLVDLTPADVTGMMRGLAKAGYSANTQSLARRTLARALRRAEQEGYVVRNVARLVDGPRADRRPESRSLSPDQARLLLDHAKDTTLAVPVAVQLGLGLRRGEALGLGWDDVDLDNEPARLRVRQQLLRQPQRGLSLEPLKTKKSARNLVLPDTIAELLRGHRAAQNRDRLLLGPEWKDDWGLIFTTPFGTPVDPDNYRHRVGALGERAGLGRIGTHTLRHSAGSFLFAMGIPMKVISETLGHATTRVTEEIYIHLQYESRAQAAEAAQLTLWG